MDFTKTARPTVATCDGHTPSDTVATAPRRRRAAYRRRVHPRLNQLKHVRVDGLMTMAALQEPEACRPTFRALRELRDRLRGELEAVHPMSDLSMGMSNDFEVAIEEGATLVRLGSVLFEGV